MLLVQGVLAAEYSDAAARLLPAAIVCRCIEHMSDNARHLTHVVFPEPACRECGRTETDAARDERAARLKGDRITVRSDIDLIEEVLRILARDRKSTRLNSSHW